MAECGFESDLFQMQHHTSSLGLIFNALVLQNTYTAPEFSSFFSLVRYIVFLANINWPLVHSYLYALYEFLFTLLIYKNNRQHF